METRDIALFLTIARLGSISRTADQFFMSQSTVTTRLQRLERSLGYELFHRTPQGVRLTRDGERLLPLAERMATLEDNMLHPTQTEIPVLRVMSGRAFVSTDVPHCLMQMVKHHNVHLKVRMGLYDEMQNALLANQVDFCFLGEPIYHARITQIEFASDFIDLVVPLNHHFVHDFPGIHAITNETFVAFGRSSSPFRKRIMNILAKSHVFPEVRMELDSIDGVKAMVSHGLGISLLPRRTLHDADHKHYHVIPLGDPDFTRPTYLAHPDSIATLPLTQTFIDVVSNYYRILANR